MRLARRKKSGCWAASDSCDAQAQARGASHADLAASCEISPFSAALFASNGSIETLANVRCRTCIANFKQSNERVLFGFLRAAGRCRYAYIAQYRGCRNDFIVDI
jgi:hypothetical protein